MVDKKPIWVKYAYLSPHICRQTTLYRSVACSRSQWHKTCSLSLSLSLSLSYLSTLSEDHLITANNAREAARAFF